MELNGKPETVACIFRETGKKEFLVNNHPYERFSEHIGRYPCVIIAPDDAILITGGSEERRKFLDAMLSQADPVYLRNLITYYKILQQRNSLLRSSGEHGLNDPSLLDVLDQQLIAPGEYIFNKRKDFLVSFLPAARHLYQEIASQAEDLNLIYESALLQAPFSELLKAARQKDLLLQRSTAGIHKDELDLVLNGNPFRNIASQGQRKSLLFALRLAEMEVLQREKGFAPLLLLDDVFEKLDEERMRNLLEKVCFKNDGQVFITDTNEHRLRSHLQQLNMDYQIIPL
jgi:DNA replication and repair protein RecF